MNNKIKELAEKAGLAQAADVRDGYIYPNGMEEFAMLIMDECASACTTFECGRTQSLQELIYKRFGINHE